MKTLHLLSAICTIIVTLSAPVSTNAGSIIITEIMPNPKAVFDNHGEWFEIYNSGSTSLDLNGWTVSDNAASSTITSLTIDPFAYLVFGVDSDYTTNGNVNINWQYTGLILANSGDVISIYDDGSNLIDAVAYTSFPYGSGVSMELDQNFYDATLNDIKSNWAAATTSWAVGSDFGTPGIQLVPIPAAVWLFGSGLLGLVGVARRKQA
jgi:hypothetical protein